MTISGLSVAHVVTIPTRLSGCILVALTFFTACSESSLHEGPVMIVAEAVFDGRAFHEGQAVLVRDGVIEDVGPAEDISSDAQRTIDLGNATLLPGLIDLHVHVGAVDNYKALPEKGVTTVRDLAIPEDVLPFAESGHLSVVAAGPIITVPDGYPIPVWGPTIAAPIEGPDEAREMVDELADKGAGVIKIAITTGRERTSERPWPTLSLLETKAIVKAAHARDLKVTVHLSDASDVRQALNAGVDEWAHIPCDDVPALLLKRAVSEGVEIVATLHVSRSCPGALANAQVVVEAGGTLLYGSDLGNEGIPFGADVQEARLMMEAGLSLEEVLAGATSLAGKQLDMEPLGSIVRGAQADLVAVPGDPRDDLHVLEDPVFVMADGDVVVDGSDER